MSSSSQANTLNLLDVDFWLWYQKVTPKGMACAFKIRFWETFNAPGTYEILTDNWYKLPNSNDGYMRLRAPTACPEWNEGMDKDEKVLHWLSQNAGLTSECVTEVIEPFAIRESENAVRKQSFLHSDFRVSCIHKHPHVIGLVPLHCSILAYCSILAIKPCKYFTKN